MPTITVENYVKQIYLEQQRADGKLVALGTLASTMNVVPGTVTTMVKGLADSGLLRYQPRQGVKLTRNGEKLALAVLRRHRLIELFLVKVLKLDWSEVHSEAEELEHALSDKLLQRIDDYLGNPQFDPHGDPIPTRTGKLAKRQLRSLSSCTAGEKVTVAFIADQAPEFLTYARRHGLTPGAVLTLKSVDPIADALTIANSTSPQLTLGKSAAAKVFVK